MPEQPLPEPWIDVVRRKVGAMRFGSVQIVVHEGRVTQVESTEKTRITDAGGPDGERKTRRTEGGG